MKRLSSALALCLLMGQMGLASAQSAKDEGATGAVNTVRKMTPPSADGPDPGSPEAKSAWAKQLRGIGSSDAKASKPVNVTNSAPSTQGAPGLDITWLVVLALLAGVGSAVGGYFGTRSRPLPEPLPLPPPPEPLPPMPAMPATHIGVLASRVIDDYGHILVLEVEDQVLAVFVDAALGQATLLCRLQGQEELPDDLPWNLERLSARVVTALRAGTPAEATREALKMVPRDTARTSEPRAPGQDEDLELLLDELLGKVRGLKPLNKQADEA